MAPRTLLIIAAILIGLTGYSSWRNSLHSPEKRNPFDERDIPKVTDTISRDDCSVYSCLIYFPESDALRGYQKIKGFYSPYATTIGFGSDTPVKCDAIVVTNASFLFIDHFKNLVKKENYLNRLDEENRLVFTLNLAHSNPIDKQKVLTSTPQKEVELDLLLPDLGDRGASSCTSFAEILNIH